MRSDYAGELWTCDACGSESISSKNEPAPGYTGTVADGLGNAWEWFACGKRCVTRALWSAGKRRDNEDD